MQTIPLVEDLHGLLSEVRACFEKVKNTPFPYGVGPLVILIEVLTHDLVGPFLSQELCSALQESMSISFKLYETCPLSRVLYLLYRFPDPEKQDWEFDKTMTNLPTPLKNVLLLVKESRDSKFVGLPSLPRAEILKEGEEYWSANVEHVQNGFFWRFLTQCVY